MLIGTAISEGRQVADIASDKALSGMSASSLIAGKLPPGSHAVPFALNVMKNKLQSQLVAKLQIELSSSLIAFNTTVVNDNLCVTTCGSKNFMFV